MGLIENALHPDRKRQQSWRQFSGEVGGTLVFDDASGCDEIHIPFMERRIRVSISTEGGKKRTTLTAVRPGGDLQFKIFGWGSRTVPEIDRDPYLNSEFPDLALRANVEFNNAKKLTSLLASQALQTAISEAPAFFTMEVDLDSIRVDNRAHGSLDLGVITDVSQLRSLLHLLKCALVRMGDIESASAEKDLVVARTVG